MKSLEIVNENLEKGDIITIVTKDYHLITKEQLETIKKDLEMLEILKKYFPKNCYPLICDRKELEKWNKAKQWLEENE